MSKPPRILFFMSTSSPIGGVETWLDRCCEYLSAHGMDPIVGLARGLKYNLPERFREYHPDLRTVEVDGRGLNREGRIRALQRCIRKVRPDIVLPLGIVEATDAANRLKAAGKTLWLVGRAQGNLPPMLADLEDYREGFDLVVCPEKLTADYLVSRAGFAPDRVHHISNGADPPTTHRVAREEGAPLRVGYVGRFSRNDKRILDLPELLKQLEEREVDYTFDLAGDGPAREELLDGLEPYRNRLTDHGPLTHEEVYGRILPRLDVLTLFSSSETFGIVLAEAMMNGVVPVTSEYVGFQSQRLVVDGEHGLSYPVGDMAAASLAVARLAESPGLLTRLSQAGQSHATQQYTWQRCLSRWQNCLEHLLERSPVEGVKDVNSAVTDAQGRLSGWLPPVAVDVVRRVRRAVLGSAVPPGGEEWPLFYRHHSADRLDQIARACDESELKSAESNSAHALSP